MLLKFGHRTLVYRILKYTYIAYLKPNILGNLTSTP